MTTPTASDGTTGPARAFRRTLLVHGYDAGIHDHWFDWLAGEVPTLERIPLPHSDRPQADAWIPAVRDRLATLEDDTAVVSHSLGGITTLRAVGDLAPRGGQLGMLVLVAPFAEPLPVTGDDDLDAFVREGLPAFVNDVPLATVAAAVRRAVVIRSDDDPLVPADASDRVARALGADLVVVPGAGHFLGDDGFTRLEPVLTALREPTGR